MPTNLDEAMKIADLMSRSNFVPREYRGNPGDILIAIQMGADVGLKPMQALQNIAIINGKPTIWGDGAIALVRVHPDFEGMKEYIEDNVTYCEIKRKGEDWHISQFSIRDAQKAGLWGRKGPWASYPNRMLQLRARSLAIQHKFSEIFKGEEILRLLYLKV